MPTLSEPTPETVWDIVEAVPDAVVVVDRLGAVRLANARAEAFFGRLRHELVGLPSGSLVPGLDLAVGQVLSGSRPGERLELSALRGTAEEHPVEVWLARVGCGTEELVSVFVRDDSERRSLREASARMRDELFASVSHELRTPLTSILGYTELLVDMGEPAVSSRAAALIEVIERNATRELRLVEDLLTLASLGASALRVDPAPLDLVPVVRDVVSSLAPVAAGSGVELSWSAAEELWVTGDRPRLEQVVRNLVGNALKFTPAGSRASVALSADRHHGVLVVEDQGVGVCDDELPRLFEGLFRGSHAVDAHLPGAGLGLPIVKGIVDAHGGEIDVQSRRGEGTRVVVRLPLGGRTARKG